MRKKINALLFFFLSRSLLFSLPFPGHGKKLHEDGCPEWNDELQMKKIILLFALSLFLFSCGNAGTAPVAEREFTGQNLFESNCTNCHGEDGKLCALGAKDLSISILSKEQVMEIITNGKSTMAPFGNMLHKEEISSVADYIQTLKK